MGGEQLLFLDEKHLVWFSSGVLEATPHVVVLRTGSNVVYVVPVHFR